MACQDGGFWVLGTQQQPLYPRLIHRIVAV